MVNAAAGGTGSVTTAACDQRTRSGTATSTSDGSTVVAELPDRSTVDYSMVGVTWQQGFPAKDLVVQIQTRTDGTWSGWQPLDIDRDGPARDDSAADGPAGTVRPGTAPTWVGHADGIGVRLESSTGTAPADVQVALIDGGTGLAVPSTAGGSTSGGGSTDASSAAYRASASAGFTAQPVAATASATATGRPRPPRRRRPPPRPRPPRRPRRPPRRRRPAP